MIASVPGLCILYIWNENWRFFLKKSGITKYQIFFKLMLDFELYSRRITVSGF